MDTLRKVSKKPNKRGAVFPSDLRSLYVEKSPDEFISLVEGRWRALFGEGNVKAAHALLKSAIDLLETGTVLWAKILVLLSYTEVELGLYEEAEKHSEYAFITLKDTAENDYYAFLKMGQGLLFLHLGKTDEALKALEDALSTYRRIGDKKNQAKACNLVAQAHYMRSNWREALEKTEMAITLAKEAKAEKDIPFYLINLGLIQIFMGDWKEAEENLDRALELMESSAESDLSAAYQALGLLLIHRRDWKRAKLYLQKSLQIALEKGSKRSTGISYEYLGELAFETGKLKEALSLYEKVLEVIDHSSALGDFLNQIERRKAEVWLALGDISKASISAKRACETSRRIGDRFEQAISLRVLGLVLQKSGDLEKGKDCLRKSVHILEEISERYERAKTCIELGRVLIDGETEDRKEALAYLVKANDLGKSLDSPFIQGLANLTLARLKLASQDTDGALLYLDEAESLLSPSKETKILSEVYKFRRKVENFMVEAALKASKGYSLLERWRISSSLSLDVLLKELSDQLRADMAFLATTSNGIDYSPVATLNLSTKEIERLIEILKQNGLKERVPLAASRANFEGLRNLSFLAIPFDVGTGIKALLFLSRSSALPFSQEQITFLSLSAELFAFRLQLKGNEQLLQENLRLKRQLHEEARFLGIVTRNPKMLDILTLIDRIKGSTIPILLQGETGTGKEVIARAIHYTSDRRDQPFLPLNCANIPVTLLESELFGHKRGAFTDAREDKKGWFEVANGGTIFLDEIAEMGPSAQAKILRFLEHHEIIPLGGREPIKVDVRILAATNKDLENEVKEGRFREDLFYRLKIFQITLPPLRERKEDIPILANYFIEKFSKEAEIDPPPRIHPQAMSMLLAYEWPGNVRELENEIRRAVVILPRVQREITAEILSISDKPSLNRQDIPLETHLEEVERNVIEQALKKANGVKTRAAEILGIPESTLRRKIKKYGL